MYIRLPELNFRSRVYSTYHHNNWWIRSLVNSFVLLLSKSLVRVGEGYPQIEERLRYITGES